jgi:uncharacterized membrane protein (UPF0182 family)
MKLMKINMMMRGLVVSCWFVVIKKKFENVELLMMVMVVMTTIAPTIVAFFVIEPIEKGKER